MPCVGVVPRSCLDDMDDVVLAAERLGDLTSDILIEIQEHAASGRRGRLLGEPRVDFAAVDFLAVIKVDSGLHVFAR